MKTKYSQGNCDNLCGVYASINAALLSTEGLAKFNKKQVREWFQLLIADLSKHRKLLTVHKEGSPVELVENYIRLLQTKLADNVILSYYKPFTDQTRTSTALKKLSILANQKNTAIVVGIQGFYDHWSVLDKIQNNRLYLNDSDSLKFLNIKNMPKRYNLTVEDTIVIKAEACKNEVYRDCTPEKLCKQSQKPYLLHTCKPKS